MLLGVKQINYCAFEDCSKLRNIEILNEIDFIHVDAFRASRHTNPITITCPQRFEEYFLERFPNAIFTRNAKIKQKILIELIELIGVEV